MKRAPLHKFFLPGTVDDLQLVEVLTIPGVWRRGRLLGSPENCAWLVAQTLTAEGVRYQYVPPGAEETGQPLPLEAIPHLNEKVLGFLRNTPYQREGISQAIAKGSFTLHWPAGCLVGDTRVLVNRGGNGRVYELKTVVERLRGQTTTARGRSRTWDLSISSFCQSVDAEGFVRLNKIMGVHQNGPAEVFELVVGSGRAIRGTANHKFQTPDGWVHLGDLKVGDTVHMANWPSSLSRQAKRKSQYEQVAHLANHPFVQTSLCKRDGRVHRVPLHRLVAEARMNGVSLPELVGRVHLGRLTGLKFLGPEFHVHHLDGNSKNNRPDNLEVLTVAEHLRRHGVESGWKHVSGRATPEKVVSITPLGVEEVYDLTMADPMQNYVANEFVVHNSGKSTAIIAWGLAAPGLCLIITGAKARNTLAEEVANFTSASALVLSGVSPPAAPASGEWLRNDRELLVRTARGLRRLSASAVTTLLEGAGPHGSRPAVAPRAQVQVLAGLTAQGQELVTLEAPQTRTRLAGACPFCREWHAGAPAGVARTGRKVTSWGVTCLATGGIFLLTQPPRRWTEVSFTVGLPEREPLPHFLIVGWETLPYHLALLQSLGATSVAWDEVHRGKGFKRSEMLPQDPDQPEKKEFKGLGNIVDCAAQLAKTVERRLATTATPVKNRLRDLWAQLDLVEPFQWGQFYPFTKRYCSARVNEWGGLDTSGVSRLDELNARLTFSVHSVSRAETHAELPPFRRQVTYLAEEDLEPGDNLDEEMRLALKRGGPMALRELQFAQSATRKRLVVESEVEAALSAGQKVVVFTGRIIHAQKLFLGLKKIADKLKVPAWLGHGGHGVEARDEIRLQYMALEGAGLIVGIGAAWGESLNLHDTDLALIVQIPYTPGEIEQQEGRFYRKGMRRSTLVKYLVAEGTVDTEVAMKVLDKLPAVLGVAKTGGLEGMDVGLRGGDDQEGLLADLFRQVTELDEAVISQYS